MVEMICVLCVGVFGYFLAWREDRKQEDIENKQADQEFNAFLEDYLKPRPRLTWDPVSRCEKTYDEICREEEYAEEEERIAKKRASRLAKLQREHRLLGDWFSVAGYDTPQEDALMSTLIEVEGAISRIENGYDD